MKTQFTVSGMSCAACQHHVEHAVLSCEGVAAVSVSLITASMTVTHDCPAARIAEAVAAAGYEATPKEAGAPILPPATTDSAARMLARLFPLLILTAAVFYLSMAPMLGLSRPRPLDPALGHGLWLLLAECLLTLPVLYGGRRHFVRGTAALLHRAPTMDTLILFGVGTAFLHGVVMILLAALFPARA
ncbi:MAG: cation-translocating P-type ATPase, partial [Clostridia bacterium]|nr:cation-translocating P-type ATPase [Clostridia bacterium]